MAPRSWLGGRLEPDGGGGFLGPLRIRQQAVWFAPVTLGVHRTAGGNWPWLCCEFIWQQWSSESGSSPPSYEILPSPLPGSPPRFPASACHLHKTEGTFQWVAGGALGRVWPLTACGMGIAVSLSGLQFSYLFNGDSHFFQGTRPSDSLRFLPFSSKKYDSHDSLHVLHNNNKRHFAVDRGSTLTKHGNTKSFHTEVRFPQCHGKEPTGKFSKTLCLSKYALEKKREGGNREIC